MNLLIHLKTTPPLLITLALLCFELLPRAQAVVPPPDGGYPGFNTAEGQNALKNLTTGSGNTAVGWYSIFSATTASFNTALGAGTLALNTADENTATGAAALLFNTIGNNNTAHGAFGLFSNSEGNSNTAIGDQALFSNTTADGNTATGAFALRNNATGSNNTASGRVGLGLNTTGSGNTAVGSGGLFSNNGDLNTAIGYQSLSSNTTGNANTAVGENAISVNVSGLANTAVGSAALSNATGDGNVAVGAGAGIFVTTADNVICIGATGGNVSGTTWIDGIYGVTTQSANTAPVIVSNDGQLGTVSSSRRFKDDIKPINKASESILALKPVSFRYKIHKNATTQFGLIAEEVAEVNPDLVIYDRDGKPYSVRYDQVNAMLLNEFLKEHRKVEQMQKQIEALTAGLERVSAQIELNKVAPQTVKNTD